MHTRLLVANRGEIAIRIIRTAADLGIETVAIAPADDQDCRHWNMATSRATLPGSGGSAYLDIEAVLALAVSHRCDAIHPGYGFLSERSDFAAACESRGIVLVGPGAAVLDRLGDKIAGLALARDCGVPVAASSNVLVDSTVARQFVEEHGPSIFKAAGGGGGRGMRPVMPTDDIEAVFDRCRSEAAATFGTDDVYAEEFLVGARHVEVQVVGDGSGAVTHLWERDCTLQRQHQKIIECAPAPFLDSDVRDALLADSERMASELRYRGLATFEFLVGQGGRRAFIEANPRLQVEHTITEAITGLDLVSIQFAISAGASLADVGLESPPAISGQAIEVRLNTEEMQPDGRAKPAGGAIETFEMPTGPGVRTDTHGFGGYVITPAFDSLLAKVVVHKREATFADVLDAARRALGECVISGVATNLEFLVALLGHPLVRSYDVSTETVGHLAPELADVVQPISTGGDADVIVAPLLGTVVSVLVANGQRVEAGAELLVMEAMKMEHVVSSVKGGLVESVLVAEGQAVPEGVPLIRFLSEEGRGTARAEAEKIDLEQVRPDLADSVARHAYGLDVSRAERESEGRSTGKRTARENLAHLVDEGSFIEYGPLVVAAQRKRRSHQELIEQTPGDGLVGGLGSVNGDRFGDESQCVVASYDYMVLAGTQGHQNHRKKDRLFELAKDLRLPVILFAEGGGGRPGDTDGVQVAGLDCLAFSLFADLSGTVPLVGINGGYCFAGNAALLGCCDVVIATEDSNVGMGGPAMIEGGGLGVFHPSEVGPIDVQRHNGVVDIVVVDEAEAVETAKRYLSYFQGTEREWEAGDQRKLRHVIPENRLRIYDVRQVIEAMFDTDSVLELRADFGLGMITSLARIEGRTVGVVANNPAHLAGAITSDGADKASRFMQLCEAFGIPIVFLCDTPGIMVGPEAEATGLVRHASRMFITGASLTVPMCTVVLRKGYGLGAQAMAGGSFKAPVFTVGWPTSEFGGMGLEGFVRLGYRNELAAIDDPEERQATYEQMVAKMYEVGKGLSMADHFEIDDVVDPADTRRWITTAFRSAPPTGTGQGGNRPFVDAW